MTAGAPISEAAADAMEVVAALPLPGALKPVDMSMTSATMTVTDNLKRGLTSLPRPL